MRGVCQAVGIDPGETDFDRHFRPIGASADRSAYSAAMLAEAEAIYEALAARETLSADPVNSGVDPEPKRGISLGTRPVAPPLPS